MLIVRKVRVFDIPVDMRESRNRIYCCEVIKYSGIPHSVHLTNIVNISLKMAERHFWHYI